MGAWLFADLITDDTTDGSAADRAQRTAAREDSTRDAANPGANSSVGVPVGHAATSEHDNYHDRHSHPDGDGTDLCHFSTPFFALSTLMQRSAIASQAGPCDANPASRRDRHHHARRGRCSAVYMIQVNTWRACWEVEIFTERCSVFPL